MKPMNEAFQVAVVIEKLPPGWKDFKNYLKHKRKEMTVQDLVLRLRIEEDNKYWSVTSSNANIVEVKKNSNLKRGSQRRGPTWDLKVEFLRRNFKANASTVTRWVKSQLSAGYLSGRSMRCTWWKKWLRTYLKSVSLLWFLK